jgi:hypothetical protein
VVRVGEVHIDRDGTLRADVTAEQPGKTTISSVRSYPPDPSGPPLRRWTLEVTVLRHGPAPRLTVH